MLVIVKNNEITIDAIVLGNQVEKRHSNVAKDEEVLSRIRISFIWLQIMTHFKNCSLCLQIIEDFRVHLQRKLECLKVNWVETIVQDSRLVVSFIKSLPEHCVLFEHRRQNLKVETSL